MAILTRFRWNDLIDKRNLQHPEDSAVSNVGTDHLLEVDDWDDLRGSLLLHSSNFFRYLTPEIWDGRAMFDLLDVVLFTNWTTFAGSGSNLETYILHSQEWADGTGFDTYDFHTAGGAISTPAADIYQIKITRVDAWQKITEFDDSSTTSILTYDFQYSTPMTIYERAKVAEEAPTETDDNAEHQLIPRIDDNSPISRQATLPDSTVVDIPMEFNVPRTLFVAEITFVT